MTSPGMSVTYFVSLCAHTGAAVAAMRLYVSFQCVSYDRSRISILSCAVLYVSLRYAMPIWPSEVPLAWHGMVEHVFVQHSFISSIVLLLLY